jgi:hypothetical protein
MIDPVSILCVGAAVATILFVGLVITMLILSKVASVGFLNDVAPPLCTSAFLLFLCAASFTIAATCVSYDIHYHAKSVCRCGTAVGAPCTCKDGCSCGNCKCATCPGKGKSCCK